MHSRVGILVHVAPVDATPSNQTKILDHPPANHRNHKTIYLNKFNPAKHNLYANYWLSRNTAVIKVDGKVKNVTMAACFLRTREFGDCGEFRGITEFESRSM